MRTVFGSLIALAAGAGLGLAGEAGSCAAPAVPIPNVTFYRALPPACPTTVGTTPVPNVSFYHAEVLPPKAFPATPVPNVTFYRAPVPNVTFYQGPVPNVTFYRAEAAPPKCVQPVAVPNVTFYRAEAAAPKSLPTTTIPNVTFYGPAPVKGCAPACPE